MTRKRRSFPIPVATNFANRDVALQVLIDLVHKFPRGPEGTLVKEDYYTYYTDPRILHGDTICGYRPIDLYRMVMNLSEVTDSRPTSEWDYRQLVRSIFPETGDRGVTRRSRRFADRLGQAVSKIQREGLPGLWKVQWGYGDTTNAMMHADNTQDAVNQAKIFFGPIIGDSEYRLGATFVREGTPLELLNANDSMLKGFDQLIVNKQRSIKKMQEEIEAFEASKQFVEMYALNCMQADLEGGETL